MKIELSMRAPDSPSMFILGEKFEVPGQWADQIRANEPTLAAMEWILECMRRCEPMGPGHHYRLRIVD